MKRSLIWTIIPSLILTFCAAQAETGHEDRDDEHEHSEDVVTLSEAERHARGIETAFIQHRALSEEFIAPGEVVTNAYRSSRVTPRISAQIVARHALLGEPVMKDQALVTLSSVEMADAQGALVVANREWQRVRKLGRKVVSERRYIEAQVARQQAYARVLAYGMTELQIDALLKGDGASKATGAFALLSAQDGTVVSDDFVVGEVVEPGRVLFDITDESVLWIEAKLTPEIASRVRIGSQTRIDAYRGRQSIGRVIQRYHRLDETTRTQSIRIEIENSDHHLHPGQFVDVAVQTDSGDEVLAVPNASLVLMEGSPTLFKSEGDALHPQPVETGVTRGGWTEIKAGLTAGDEIVVEGVFLLKSMLLKSHMGEGHVH